VYQDNSGLAVVWLVLSLVVLWLIIYSAVRAAVAHALDRSKPRLVAQAYTTPEGVQFVVSNIGTGAAFDVSVRWTGRPAAEALARIPLLGRNGTLEWTLLVELRPDDLYSVGLLTAAWSPGLDPAAIREYANLAVLVPSRVVPPK
jgi:hypothetical protein